MTREIASIAWAIEQDTLPKLQGSHVDNMERIFAVIDNFNDVVLPRVNEDVSQLESLVNKLEAFHESQTSPVTSFLSGILRAGGGSPPTSGGLAALEAQRASIKLHSKDELLEMMYTGDVISSSASGEEEGDGEVGGGEETGEEQEVGGEEGDVLGKSEANSKVEGDGN